MEQHRHLVLGMREHWGQKAPFVLLNEDRRQHFYVLGKSGTGKTTLLRNLILQDIEAGRGVGVIDPHGDMASDLLDHIPGRRIDDVVYFNPADAEYPVGFNLLNAAQPSQRHLVASGIVSAFKSIWGEFFGPRMEYILYAAIAALLECQDVSLLGLPRMLSDARYRAWVVRQVKDPIVRSFWVNEFENYDEKFRREAVAPILNKVGQLLMSPQLRNILGQVRNRMDAEFIMGKGRIFIADLSKGKLGADKSNLIGAFLITQFQLAAMFRASIPEQARRDFYLYVDEFQSFATDSFVSILSEARKYGLCLILSHQYIEQLKPNIRDAVFGNVGSIMSFRVGQQGAETLEREFGSGILANIFTRLNNHDVCVRLLKGGEWSEPFMGTTLPPKGKRYGKSDAAIGRSRQTYSTQREIVEQKIGRWIA